MTVKQSVRRAYMSEEGPFLETLRKAQLVTGGTTELAQALGVSIAELNSWFDGGRIPIRVYLAALKIVEESEGRSSRKGQ